ncbi:hypothetical protein AB0M20_39390 [Actinoplanes sp. NPDC051633]|uniref:5-methylcytosine restriction system specificity protein McrC n=1 Tax=Actinoplanes sp. NPDC051633 TaxID=3155670 RepID=UPI003449D5D7
MIERLTPVKKTDTYDIQPGPYVGRFRLRSGRVVNVSSRFSFADLATLLALGRKTTMLYDDATAAGRSGEGLVDLIALAFVREVERIAGHGLLKGYERRTYTRPPYAGAPSMTVHLSAHAGRPDRMATTASRLTQDLTVNRIIAAAHRRLCGLTYLTKGFDVRLRALQPVFQQLTPLDGPAPRVDVVPPRYRDAYQLARLVLGDRRALPTGVGVAGVSVLFNMTQIWEEYVGRWVSAQFPDCDVSAQHKIPIADKIDGWADLVVLRKGVPEAVFDAKYRPWKERPTTSEVYQMFTYAKLLGVSRAALVHPGEKAQSASITIGGLTIENRAIPIV